MFDCLFIGSSTQDILLLVDAPPSSDQRISASRMAVTCGGPGSTAAVAFSALGGRAALITAVGSDDTGRFIRRDLEARRFACLQLFEIPGAVSSLSAIQVERDGRRCITCYGGCTDHMMLSMLDRTLLSQAPLIHLAGLSEPFLIEAVHFCQRHSNAIISVDGGNYSLEAVESILPDTDLFIPDDKTVAKTLGISAEEACVHYHRLGAGTVCITLGGEGSLAYDGTRFFRAPAARAHVLDTTGAGDNFHGAFLYCVLQKYDLLKTLHFCNTFAALTCEGLGGRESLPPLEDVLAKMEVIRAAE